MTPSGTSPLDDAAHRLDTAASPDPGGLSKVERRLQKGASKSTRWS